MPMGPDVVLRADTGSLSVAIRGYRGPLTEGKDLLLTCIIDESNVDVDFKWIFTPNGTNTSQLMSQNETYAKHNLSVLDSGDYACNAAKDSVSVWTNITVEIFPPTEKGGGDPEIITDISIIIVAVATIFSLCFLIILAIPLSYYFKKIHKRRRRVGQYSSD